ncbi:MAG TPA: hypothetical protein VN522_01500 [Solirubrobacterales bacterium]|nr:hypothetical protein [Solirubrobacterales bacterium]
MNTTFWSRRRELVAGLLVLAVFSLAGLAQAETVQHGGLRVAFEGKLSPKALPRSAEAGVSVSVSVKVSSTTAKPPPPMTKMSIAINRYGHLNRTGLPVCQLEQIQPATTQDALAACHRSLVGEGRFLASVVSTGTAPFPSEGKVYAFNGEFEGRPAILAHVYGTKPAPASYTIPFVISPTKGTFGTTLEAAFPPVKAGTGYITAIYLSLSKSFVSHGKHQSYFSASCPAPKDLSQAIFSFAKANVTFQGGPTLGQTLTRTCEAKG